MSNDTTENQIMDAMENTRFAYDARCNTTNFMVQSFRSGANANK